MRFDPSRLTPAEQRKLIWAIGKTALILIANSPPLQSPDPKVREANLKTSQHLGAEVAKEISELIGKALIK